MIDKRPSFSMIAVPTPSCEVMWLIGPAWSSLASQSLIGAAERQSRQAMPVEREKADGDAWRPRVGGSPVDFGIVNF